ncbi:uncharacterized protein Tco025E_03192 [Trypanosoma conorhini]|uniref:Uncharacterized protein n=1 Tax=Trypanosoma conorhini TaxID=83891 RepID=A0A422PX91_9TRYP|nr:uncharacterized protein Tco025E_03192 [Trypanosoma conorhini]RNF22350.1 hypothetical protein Tco025E_03192 [Trypanosoma conorhini]
MLTTPNDVETLLAAVQTDSSLASREAADALHQRVSVLCEAQRLAHDRHCRRIYNTLCKFLKPEEVVQRRQTTAACCHAWKSVAANCGEAVAAALSRLTGATPESHGLDETATVTFLLSLVEIDMREVGEGLAALERALQQLRSDAGREQAEASDMAAQRKALRRRRVQRVLALQVDRDRCAQLLEGESNRLGQLAAQATRLRVGVEGHRAQTQTGDALARVGRDAPKFGSLHGPKEVRQLDLDLTAHEKSQSDLLAKARSALDDMGPSSGHRPAASPLHAPRPQARLETALGKSSAALSASDPAVSLLARAERLLNAAWTDAREVQGGGPAEATRQDDPQLLHGATLPALATPLLRQRRHAAGRPPSTSPPHSPRSRLRDAAKTAASGSRERLPRGTCVAADARPRVQQQEWAQRHRQRRDAGGSSDDGGSACPAPSHSGCSNALESSAQASDSESCQQSDLHDSPFNGAKGLELQPSKFSLASAAVTPLPCEECRSPPSEAPAPVQSRVRTDALSGDRRQNNTTTQPIYRPAHEMEERKLHLTRSKALLLARLHKLARMPRNLLPSDEDNIAFATN